MVRADVGWVTIVSAHKRRWIQQESISSSLAHYFLEILLYSVTKIVIRHDIKASASGRLELLGMLIKMVICEQNGNKALFGALQYLMVWSRLWDWRH